MEAGQPRGRDVLEGRGRLYTCDRVGTFQVRVWGRPGPCTGSLGSVPHRMVAGSLRDPGQGAILSPLDCAGLTQHPSPGGRGEMSQGEQSQHDLLAWKVRPRLRAVVGRRAICRMRLGGAGASPQKTWDCQARAKPLEKGL